MLRLINWVANYFVCARLRNVLAFRSGRLKGALGRPPIEDLFFVVFLNERHKKTNKKQKRNRKTVSLVIVRNTTPGTHLPCIYSQSFQTFSETQPFCRPKKCQKSINSHKLPIKFGFEGG
jgi:hypothetical protein